MSSISRRSFAAATVTATGCWRKEKPGFAGFAFVANEEGSAVAAVDLSAFAVVRHIPLNSPPTQLISHDARKMIYALTPGNGAVHEISSTRLARQRSTSFGGKALHMRLSPARNALFILNEEPRQIVEIRIDDMRVASRFALPARPLDLDMDRKQPRALVSFATEGSVGVVDLAAGRMDRVETGSPAGIVRFRKDGQYWMSAHEADKQLAIFDTATARVVTRLPLAVKPRHVCFKSDEGQMFFTGEGMDAVAVVYPYMTEVAETVLAGHGPAAMAASYMIGGTPEFLFVSNPASSQVTILNINESYKLVASIQVGAEPSFITLTPDNQCVLVLNRKSGDMAVLMASNSRRAKQIPTLFTMIPVGSKPVCAVVQAV